MVYIFLGRGFEEIEAVAPYDILKRGAVPVKYAAVGNNIDVEGGHGIRVTADLFVGDIKPSKDDLFVIPGGMGGVDSIKSDKAAMALLGSAAKLGSGLAAICAGPSVLASLGLLDGRQITCYPGCEDMMGKAKCRTEFSIMNDAGLITGRAPGSAIDFGLALLERTVGAAVSEKARKSLVY